MTDANLNNNNNNIGPQPAAKFQPGSNPAPSTNTTTTTPVAAPATTKPRLSLLSASKQSVMRINSDDNPDQHQQQQTITILSGTHDDFARVDSSSSSSNSSSSANLDNQPSAEENSAERLKLQNDENNKNSNETTAQNNNGRNTQSEEGNRMNISNEDLIRLLSMLKSELQSKEIALAAIKCEQLKRLINPVEISRSSLANTYIELQDRIKICDPATSSTKTNETLLNPSASKNENDETNQRNNNNINKSLDIVNVNNQTKENNVDDEESLNILNTLLELLDRHPLLALPRDSIYCLDYNCNELSTKNYLNLKIQHLDNLINQHRRYRYYMNERLKKSEQRYLELTHQLELERLLKSEIEKSAYKATGRAILLKHIDQLKEALEKEKSDKQVIVMTLLNELLDERERSQRFMKRIGELEQSSNNISSISSIDGKLITGESVRIEKLEKEVGELMSELKKLTLSSAKEKRELELRSSNLLEENLTLKSNLEQLEAKLIASMKSKSKEFTPGAGSPSSPTRGGSNKQVIPGGKGNCSSPTGPGLVSRLGGGGGGSVGLAKSSPAAKASSSASSSTQSSLPQRGHSAEGNQQVLQQRQPAGVSSKPTGNQPKTATEGPTVGSSTRIAGNNSNETQIRIQPLFKTTPVMSANQQQARNLKTSMSTGGIGSGINPFNNNNNSSPPVGSSRAPNLNNQTVTKPRVPAKPAQLLDQQRNSVN